MAIETYISDLLYRYECVIIPNFGAFITQRQPASFRSETNEFHPPAKTVSFNGQLKKNDGLLANYIMEVENISYKKAVEKLGIFVEDLQQVLQGNEPVDLKDIGSLRLTAEDKILFEPAAGTNYLKEAFGLSHFVSAGISKSEYGRTISQDADAPIVLNKEKKNSRPYLRYAAVGLLALGLSGFTGLNIYSNQITRHNLAEQLEAASQLEDRIQKATFVIENPLPAVTLKISKQEGNFHIIAGAFRMEENADEKVELLRKEGFPARKIKENRYGLHQVVYSSHKTKREAINNLWSIKRSSNPNAWLLVQEL